MARPKANPAAARTLHAPRASRYRPDPAPDLIRPATREETMPVALASLVLSLVSLVVCTSHNYLLLYGDAVAHLGIARRVVDTRNPGLQQLGGVWLPLPHLVLLPFVQNMQWWQNGLAGAWPSMAFYILGAIAFYRLARRLMVPRWAFAATAFYLLNPNLLYLATTAMTEPLFLAILLWLVLLTLEAVAAIRSRALVALGPRLLGIALLILAAVYTRYDGWILGAAVWLTLTILLVRHREVLRHIAPAYVVFTLITVAGPISWFVYNHVYAHDWLDFMRGPYSAYQIDLRTKPPGSQHHRGWHNPAWALLFYTRTAQVDSTAWEFGFLTLAAALTGTALLCRRILALTRAAADYTRDDALGTAIPYGREALVTLLLWLPLPFYVYSIAYGSVPIFIPNLWPHAFYNSRYGVELLPALALFLAFALAALELRLKPLQARLLQPVTLAVIAANTVAMVYTVPLVLREAQHNSMTRIPFEAALARALGTFPAGVPILFYNSDHIGALQQAGIPLKQTLNEGDFDSFHAALAAPAQHAAYVIAIAGDPVDAAVRAHPENLTELEVLCTTGQPCARVYRSEVLQPQP